MSSVCRVISNSWPSGDDEFDTYVSRTEIIMIRTLTILILSITQVLSGFGCGGYLCFHKDGTYCCVDGGAESCHCCADSAESADVPCKDQCSGHKHAHECCAIADNSETDTAENLDSQTRLYEFPSHRSLPCGCIHIPIVAPAAKVERTAELSKLKSCCIPCSQLSHFAPSRVAGPGHSILESLSPQIPQLRVLSQHRCVVIRC